MKGLLRLRGSCTSVGTIISKLMPSNVIKSVADTPLLRLMARTMVPLGRISKTDGRVLTVNLLVVRTRTVACGAYSRGMENTASLVLVHTVS